MYSVHKVFLKFMLFFISAWASFFLIKSVFLRRGPRVPWQVRTQDETQMTVIAKHTTANRTVRTQDIADDAGDDDDDEYLTLARCPEILAVITKYAAIKCISMAQNKQVRTSAHGSINHTAP